ncbi:hypothetical protein IFR05_001830 [Cadophora sp. M221]|nr:hypothetical protein IFR05_001830 [Cadophora sp. M221]
MSEVTSITSASNQSTMSEKLGEFLFNTQRLLEHTSQESLKAPHIVAINTANQIAVLEFIENLPYPVQEDAIVGWLRLQRQWFKTPKAEELLEQVMLDVEKSAMDALDVLVLEMAGFLGGDAHYEQVRRAIVQGHKGLDLLARMRLRILEKYSAGGEDIESIS